MSGEAARGGETGPRVAGHGAFSPDTDLSPSAHHPPRSRAVLETIALFKFLKALALLVAGVAAFGLLDGRLARAADHALEQLALGHGHRLASALAARALPFLGAASPRHVVEVGIGALLYAGVFLVEGVGLWRARPWAEWLTIGVTLSFLPFEILAVVRRTSFLRVATLALNVAVVCYLAWRLWMVHRDRGDAASGNVP